MATEPREQLVVREKSTEAPGVCTLQLSRADGTTPQHTAGQFINVYFPELGTPEGKGYSISSAPSEKMLTITVKEIGEFSRRLCAMQAGDTLTTSEPCGYFFSESPESPLVMVAGGIGISPFRSILLDALEKNPARTLMLFYSNKTPEDIVFKKLFDEVCAAHKNVSVTHFITQQEVKEPMISGHVEAKSIISRLGSVQHPEFLLCGSISFIRDLWRGLRAEGVPEEVIYTEAFFSH